MHQFYSMGQKMMVWIFFVHFKNFCNVKRYKTFCLGSECTISGYRGCKNGFTPNACIPLSWPKMLSLSVLEHFVKVRNVKKMLNLCIGHECIILGYRSWGNAFAPNSSIVLLWSQNDFCECFGTVVNLLHVKRWKTCVSGVNALLRGTEVAKIISHQMHPFVSVLEHFGDLRNVKKGETCVSCLNALFRGIEVAQMISEQLRPFY
jgi:hypothetical protein